LAGIAGLIGLTVVFACGVERGKQLARYERVLLAREPAAPPARPQTSGVGARTPEPEPSAAHQSSPARDATVTPQSDDAQKPAPAKKVKVPTKLAAGGAPAPKPAPAAAKPPSRAGTSRYAIQVIAYSRMPQARQELERLRARGERAFLVMRNGRTIVFVGPFPSKGNAVEKLTSLRTRYQDCFVKTL
jgi:cell division septation protein DedD